MSRDVSGDVRVYVAETRVNPTRSAGYILLRVPQIEDKVLDPGEGLLAAGEHFMEQCEGHPTILALINVDNQGHTITSVLNSGNEESSKSGSSACKMYQAVIKSHQGGSQGRE